MICDDVIDLIQETPAAHGIFDKTAETARRVYCQVNSVTRNEFWRAHENEIIPRYVFKLSEEADYQGEKVVVYRGERLRIIRTYVQKHAIELTAGEVTVDAKPT